MINERGHWVFHETARQRTLLAKCRLEMSKLAIYTPCGPSAPIEAQVIQVRRFRPSTSGEKNQSNV
jgi:hypothetical protein